MKKLIATILTAITVVFTGAFAVGCGPTDKGFNVYMPDGAPALALSKLMVENETLGVNAKYHVSSATAIGSYVANGSADIAILPIADASTAFCFACLSCLSKVSSAA